MFLKVLRVGPPQFCYEEVYGLTPKRSVSLTSIKLLITGDLESQRTLHPLTPQLLLTTIIHLLH